jgi:hypothetical protein
VLHAPCSLALASDILERSRKTWSNGHGEIRWHQRAYGEEHSMVPGFKTVSMRDIIVQPGEQVFNDGRVAAIMRITDLKA